MKPGLYVWRIGGGIPTYRHETLRQAAQEAERLALAHPGLKFTVIEVLGTVTKSGVSWDVPTLHDAKVPF